MALIVLLLTVQPVFARFISEKETACSATCCGNETDLPADDDQPGNPCSDFCNPLLNCGTCAASTIEFLAFSLNIPRQELPLHIMTSQGVCSQFAPDFWQPPRIA